MAADGLFTPLDVAINLVEFRLAGCLVSLKRRDSVFELANLALGVSHLPVFALLLSSQVAQLEFDFLKTMQGIENLTPELFRRYLDCPEP